MNAADALLELLRSISVAPDTPVSLLEIGPPLVGQGFTEETVLDALFWLDDSGAIELIPGNRLRLVKL